ncbi:MAG: transcriptional regulator [Proteobacteria bacterium]|nr:MAG: transcriptional regulator [Pseudomonadota bacterium]
MSKQIKALRSHCPINFALEMFGDKWSLLILRDIIFRGKKSFGEFLRSEEGFATNILSVRLQHLLEIDILTKDKDEVDARKDVYRLSEKGLDLVPMLMEMILWSAKYDPDSEAQRIKPLLSEIRADNRTLSTHLAEKVRRGEGIVKDYLG